MTKSRKDTSHHVMARVEISGEFNYPYEKLLQPTRVSFYFFIGSDAFTASFSNRRYSLESKIVEQGEIARETSIIKGDLSGGLLFSDRKVRSVKLTREFEMVEVSRLKLIKLQA